MPTYKAPVDDTLFLLRDVFDSREIRQPAPLRRGAARRRRGGAERGRQIRRGSVCSRSTASATWRAASASDDGSRRRRRRVSRKPTRPMSRAAGSASRAIRNTADRACRIFSASLFSEYSDRRQHRPSRCIPASPTARSRRSAVHGERRAQEPLSAEDDDRRMDGHDEPDRAALRHGPRPHQDARPCRRPTAPSPSPARRSSSPPASTTSPTTSSISCSRASRARPRA